MRRSILPLLLSLALCLGMLPTAALAENGDTTTEGYSIDYAEETITIAEGYSLYTQQSGGEAIFTSSAGNNTTSLTNYIKNAEQKLYLQAPATGGAEQPDRREITIPARPQAPTVSPISIDYSEEKLTFPPDVTAATLEYALSKSDPNWQDVPSGAALSEMEWDGNTPKTYYFRTGATETSFASSATTTPIIAPARPAKPADPTTVEVTSNSITIQVVSGQEYRLGPSGEWKTLQETTGSDGKTVYTYDKLEPGTQYTIKTRTPAETTVENKFASFPASVTVTTKYETELGNLKVTGNTGTYGRFQYGDIITVTFTPEQKADTSTNALAENTATLTYTSDEGEVVTLATATAQADGSFTLSYDTREKRLPCKDNMTLNVSYSGSGELNPAEETATVSLESATLKNLPTVTGKFEFGQTLTAHYEKQDDETVTYQWLRDGANLTGATEITYTLTEEDIGKNIEVKVIASDYWHYGSRASNHQMVVSKAPGSIEIACDSVTYGEAIQLSVTSNTNTGANVTYSYAGTGSTRYGPSATAPINAGTYTVTATVAETATHTAATSEPVAFTIGGPPVPPANPNYRVDIPTPENGTVTANPAAAKAGETVTLTPTPDAGYEVGEITVTDRFGDAVEVTANPDGTYTFTMPNGQVRVEVTFVEATPEPLPFTDVAETDWFHDAVQYAYENGLMDGVGDGQFAPHATTNRAMVVTILYRLAGEPAVSGDVGFTDVAAGQWYTDAVLWAAQKGIVNGISATEFSPSGDLTREQLATILYRYAQDQGYDVSASADLSGFPDAGDIQVYATQALSWAVAEGLLQGFEDDTLQPQFTATRAQIATILMRFCETVAE